MPRRMPDPSVEVPSWVRHFDPDAWSEPDKQEELMSGGGPMPEPWHRWHVERRWHEARNDWYRAHPECDHRLEEMIERRRRRLAGE
jgi:hypothetical protein